MRMAALLIAERDAGQVPICRTRDPAIVARLARTALAELRQAADAESDELLANLLRHEAEKLSRTLSLFGIATVSGDGHDE